MRIWRICILFWCSNEIATLFSLDETILVVLYHQFMDKCLVLFTKFVFIEYTLLRTWLNYKRKFIYSISNISITFWISFRTTKNPSLGKFALYFLWVQVCQKGFSLIVFSSFLFYDLKEIFSLVRTLDLVLILLSKLMKAGIDQTRNSLGKISKNKW